MRIVEHPDVLHPLPKDPPCRFFGRVRSVGCRLSVYLGGSAEQTVQIGEAKTVSCIIIVTCAFLTFTYNLINNSITKIMNMVSLDRRFLTLQYEITKAKPVL